MTRWSVMASTGLRLRVAMALEQFMETRSRPQNAASTIGGIELIHRISKGQFALGRQHVSGTAIGDVDVVLAA